MLSLNNKQRKVLESIFERPTRSNIAWPDIERLIIALGGVARGKGGSMVGIRIGDVVGVVHRPHPQKKAKKYMVERIRNFLTQAGMSP